MMIPTVETVNPNRRTLEDHKWLPKNKNETNKAKSFAVVLRVPRGQRRAQPVVGLAVPYETHQLKGTTGLSYFSATMFYG